MGFYPSGSKVEPIMCVLLSPLIRVSHYQSVTIWILDLIERSIAMLGSDNLLHHFSRFFLYPGTNYIFVASFSLTISNCGCPSS